MTSRYFYYLILLNMLANIIVFVPKLLIEERTGGAMMSMMAALPLGVLGAYFFARAMSSFEGKSLPQILKDSFVPGWAGKPLILYLAFIWMASGFITLYAFTDITERFINPDMENWQIAVFFLLFIVWAASSKPEKVLYLLEIILILNGPLAVLLLIKIYLSGSLSWLDIKEAATHLWEMPTWKSVSAATYVFSGYANLVIFNTVLKGKAKPRFFLLVLPAGAAVLATTYFVPIGTFGFEGVGDLEYPWLSSADAVRMELAFVERAFYIFILIYIGISLMNVVVHWHVAQSLIRSAVPLRAENKNTKTASFKKNIPLLLFAVLFFIGEFFVNEEIMSIFTVWWMNIRMPSEYIMVVLLIFLSWRKNK
ncbi:GerAB/ArcD/ProY family transporter [Bacillus infantis]|uniref:GerAB/ArcD/ProY family transporter n=1 Tax=Bacillus infantis TaxID=324767 RepID=UPI003CF48BF3